MKIRFYERDGQVRIEIYINKRSIIDRKMRESDKEQYSAEWAKFLDSPIVAPEPELEIFESPEPEIAEPESFDEDYPEPDVVLDLDIFASTVTKALKAGGINTIDELCALSEEDMLDRTKGIGPRKLKDMREVMASHGLAFSE